MKFFTTESELSSILEEQVLLIDKPLDWTSFDVVNRLRFTLCRKFGIKKLKVGHAGTLDPKATGLLIVCTGKATKRITEFQDQSKTYSGVFALGATRPSYDVETEIDQVFPVEHINEQMLEDATKSFLGTQAQMPPIFSAIKQDGKPIYKKAHLGESVVVQARQITINTFATQFQDFPDIQFQVNCSKGTYIRSLAFDFGQKLNSGAYLKSLRRDKIGDHSLEDAWQLDELISYIQAAEITKPN